MTDDPTDDPAPDGHQPPAAPAARAGSGALDLPPHLLEEANFDPEAAEREAEAALARDGTDLPKHDLLSFYDRLRQRILDTVERRAGRLPEDVIIALLLVPDVFILLVRLTFDKDVPRRSRLLIGGALAYFISPFDLLPEALLGPIGYLDDLVLAVAILSQVLAGDLEPYARKHWNGKQDLQTVLRDVTATSRTLLGPRIHDRLQRLLARHGIHLGGGPKSDG